MPHDWSGDGSLILLLTYAYNIVQPFLDYGNATLIRIPTFLCRHLQSVLNTAARSIAGLRRSDHITETLASLHWLCASERIQFKLAMLVFRSLHGLAPQYLADDLIRVADTPSRHRLRSARTHRLEVPRGRRATVGDRTFRAAGSRLCNGLPSDVVDCQTVDTFRRRLKHFFLMLRSLDIARLFVFGLFSCGP